MRKSIVILLILMIYIFSACSILPQPEDLIKAPAEGDAVFNSEHMAIVQNRLPEGAKLLKPNNPEQAEAIQMADMDGDGEKEILATYKISNDKTNAGQIGAMLIKKSGSTWKVEWEASRFGDEIDWAEFVHATDTSVFDFVIAYSVYKDAQKNMVIYTWRHNQVYEAAKLNYDKLEISDLKGPSGSDGIVEFGVWQKDFQPGFKLYRLSSNREEFPFVIPIELYQSYYGKVVEYYESIAKEQPDNTEKLFTLAIYKSYAGDYDGALQIIREAKRLTPIEDYYSQHYNALVEVKLLKFLGEYDEAIRLCENVIKNAESNIMSTIRLQPIRDIYGELASIYYNIGEDKKAETVYEALVNKEHELTLRYGKMVDNNLFENVKEYIDPIVALQGYLDMEKGLESSLPDLYTKDFKVNVVRQEVKQGEKGLNLIWADFDNPQFGKEINEVHVLYWMEEGKQKYQFFSSYARINHFIAGYYEAESIKDVKVENGILKCSILFRPIVRNNEYPPLMVSLRLVGEKWEIAESYKVE